GRARFLEGLARALAAAAGPGGTLIFDDLQWCDASTIEVALHLTRLAPAGELRLLGTARPAELSANPAAARTLASLEHEGQLLRIDLEPLGDLEVLALVRALSGGGGAQLFSRRLHAATEGNPLYILETLRALFAAGLLQAGEKGWSTPFDEATSDYAELPIAPSVQGAVLRRVDALGGATRRLLELASLAGSGFGLELLAGASALSEWEQLEALERALAAHLIAPLGAGYRFSHELVRRALEGAILPERRQLSHRRLAANLARAGGAPGQIADHFERGGQPSEAVPYRVRAAEASARVFSHKEALDEYRRALQDEPDQRTAVQIHLARAELLAAMGRYLAVDAELRLASRKVSGLDDPALTARVMLAEAGLHNAQGRYLEGLALTERVLARDELPDLLRPGALYERGNALLRLGRLAEAEPCLRAALAQTPDDAHDLSGRINAHLQACAMQRGDLPLAQRHNAAALRAFQAAGSRAGAARALGGSGLLLGLLGDAQAATRVLEEALNEAREIGDVGLQRTLLLNLFKFQLEKGELEAAVPRLEEGLALAREPQDPYLEGIFLNNLGVLHRHRGDLGAALRAFEGALDLADQVGIVAHQVRRRLTIAENHLDLGDPEGALERIEEARQLAAPDGLGELQAWLGNLLARCELARGTPAAALSRLETLLASGLKVEADDQARTQGLVGVAQLALGAPGAALDHLSPLELPLDPLLGGWLLSVRLQAHTRLGVPAPEDTASAENLLA
ncbi:MAG: ATP-binding protein, partial [Deinococcus sp.]